MKTTGIVRSCLQVRGKPVRVICQILREARRLSSQSCRGKFDRGLLFAHEFLNGTLFVYHYSIYVGKCDVVLSLTYTNIVCTFS